MEPKIKLSLKNRCTILPSHSNRYDSIKAKSICIPPISRSQNRKLDRDTKFGPDKYKLYPNRYTDWLSNLSDLDNTRKTKQKNQIHTFFANR